MGFAYDRQRRGGEQSVSAPGGEVADFGSNHEQSCRLEAPPEALWLGEGESTALGDTGTPDWALADEPLLSEHKGSPTQSSPIPVPEAVNPPAERERGRRQGDRDIRILRGPQAPVPTTGTQPMEESRLYAERPSEGECVDGWSPITHQYGTAQAPYESAVIDPTTLFVGGGPVAADINQGALGDCYLLAALTAVVESDPGKIVSMVALNGENAQVDWFHFDAGSWVPVTIDVSLSFLHSAPTDGTPSKLLAAAPRLGAAPARREWWADLSEDELQVCTNDFYEASLWVPVIEKAYAVFAERYGQRGGASGEEGEPRLDKEGNPRSGYDIIGNGGQDNDIYPLIYGADAFRQRTDDIGYDPEALPMNQNLSVLRDLILLDSSLPDGDEAMLTVCLGEDDALARLHQQLLWTQEQPFASRYPGLLRWMGEMDVLLDAWEGAAPEDQKARREVVSEAARRATAPGAWPVLDSDREEGDFRGLQELLLAVSSIDSKRNGPRSVLTPHAYTVLGSSLVGAEGRELSLTPDNLEKEASQIDPAASTVELRNPHGENEPSPSGALGGDGVFELNLEQFFRLFSHASFTRVHTESP